MTDNDETDVIISCPNCNKVIGYDENCPCGFDDDFNGRKNKGAKGFSIGV